MRIRTVYLKVRDLEKALPFWQKFLALPLAKRSEGWCEFKVGETNFALFQAEPNDKWSGTSCLPVFEYGEVELQYYLDKAVNLGAELLFDGLQDPGMQSALLRDPTGQEFELSRIHE